MKPEVLQGHLDGWLTDTCNRYLNLVDDLGIVDRKKRTKKSKELLEARNALLDKWAPLYAKRLSELLAESAIKAPEGKRR